MSDAPSRLDALVAAFAGVRVLVVGDMVADRYILAEPARLSREAPVIVARHVGEEIIPGGAANAMNNLLDLGATVIPVGVVGMDDEGARLTAHFQGRGLDVSGIIRTEGGATVSKTRVMVGDPGRMKQQVLRIDREPDGEASPKVQACVVDIVRERLGDVDAVLFSDYGYGAVGGSLIDAVRGGAGDRVVSADSRYDIRAFRGVSIATPNEGEVEEALGIRIRSDDELERAGETLRRALDAPALLITRGNRGMSLFRDDAPRLDVPATGSDEVTDVSGAGDTVISVVTLALAAGARLPEAAVLANLAAGVVVMKLGAATCTPKELAAARRRYA